MTENRTNTIALFFARPWVRSVSSVLLIFGVLGAFIHWYGTRTTVSIEKSVLSAPVATIAPTMGGILNAVYVEEGDFIPANTPIAQVGAETLFAKEAGIVSGAAQALGTFIAPGHAVYSVISTERMRVAGTIEETEGLARIQTGQRVVFTIDAFPGQSYEGVVDAVSPASDEVGIAFSISDKRPTKKFTVYARFDTAAYPELKNGMSAKMTVHTSTNP